MICISSKVVFQEFALCKDDDKAFAKHAALKHPPPLSRLSSVSNDHHVYNAMTQAVNRELHEEGEDGKQEE